MVEERAYAKINLTLNVGPVNDKGYHDIESIMVPVDLYDTLTFEENGTDEMILVGSEIENDIILTTALAFQEKYKTKGATITIKKEIPLEAGLAGGSADSSATLRGLNRLFELNKSLEELDVLAQQLGSDTSFTLYSRPAVCTGRGEKLQFVDFTKDYYALLMKPEYGISTAEAYKNCTTKTLKNSTAMLKSLMIGGRLYPYYTNDLVKSAKVVEPRIKDDIELIELLGFSCNMSGSGSTIYVIDDLYELIKLERNVSHNFAFTKIVKLLRTPEQ